MQSSRGALHWVTKQIVTPPLPHLTSEGVARTGFIVRPLTSTKKVKKRIGLISLQFLSFRSQPYSEGVWLTQGNEKGNMKNELLDDLVKAGAWIKWLNTVTSGSQESPVIAIFPSSTIAEHALNTMSRFKFKLCHSQHQKKKKAVTLMRIRTLLFRPRRRRFYVPLFPKTLFLFYIWFFIWITRRKLQVLMMIGLLS